MWLIMAVLSAFFAGITAILTKCGVKETDSDAATALRTTVVFIFAWLMVFITGAAQGIFETDRKSLLFLILSGMATGASWLCYFKALSLGDINKVVPIDKSSAVLTVILSIILFNETNNLPVKIIGIVFISIGTYLMIERKKTDNNKEEKPAWFIYALLSAVFASLTAVLSKIGIENVNSNLGTAIRTGVVLIMAWLIVIIQNKQKCIKSINKKELIFLIFSGIATGASWLCYYYAIKYGIVSVVVPIDKLSILFTIGFSYIVFGERLNKKSAFGLILITVGTLLMALLA